MGQYEDVSEVAYAGKGLASLTAAERIVFEEAITAVGVPPSLRVNARLNLYSKYCSGGISAVRAVKSDALARRQAADTWMLRRKQKITSNIC